MADEKNSALTDAPPTARQLAAGLLDTAGICHRMILDRCWEGLLPVERRYFEMMEGAAIALRKNLEEPSK